jgi:hypothetical protein
MLPVELVGTDIFPCVILITFLSNKRASHAAMPVQEILKRTYSAYFFKTPPYLFKM